MEIGARCIAFIQLIFRWIMTPIYFIWASQTVSKSLPPIKNPILFLSARTLAKKIRKRELKSEEVVRAYITRLQEINPYLNAVVEDRYLEAIKEAQQIDKQITLESNEIENNSPLLGVPITVKESCCVKGMSQSVGSLPRHGIKADKDGVAVNSLRKAGAIPLLVSSTPEYCLSWETNNLVTGRTVNAYDHLRTPGGSSGGEAALIGSGSSVIGVGSDLAGSIRIPAMFNGIFGHKPTPGYVSIEGHFPTVKDEKFQNYLTVGPIARYAEDLKLLLGIMAGEKAAGLKLNEEVDLHTLKVHYMCDVGFSLVLLPVEDSVKKAITSAAQHLNAKYGIPLKEGGFKEMEDSAEMSISVFFGLEGVPNALEDYATLKKSNEQFNLLTELVKSMFGMSYFSFSLLIFYCLQATNAFIPTGKYKYYYKCHEALKKKFTDVLGDNGVFLYPTFPTAAFYHNESYTKTSGVMYAMVFNILGLPSTHVPLGFNKEGLPIGFQVVAAPHQDRLCLAVAEALEKDFGGWIPPSTNNTDQFTN